MRKVAGIYKVLCRLEKEAPSSIIHSHFAYPGGLGGTLMNSVPQLLTLRGYDILTTGTYGALWNPFFRLNLVNAYRRHGTVTAGSSHSFQRARQILGPDADLRLLLQGIDTATFEPSGAYTRQSLDLPTDGFVFLAVGNLVEVKNHAMLIHALQRVVAQSPRPVHLLICGDGPLGTSLRETTRQLGMEKHVQFMGRLSRRELADIYCLSDIFVHPSLSEGFGNVLLEAMLHRLLIVSSPVGIAPDVIRHGDNGFLPLLGDDRSLAECLLEAMQLLPRFKHAAESNREMVLARFGMEKRIDGYMSLYRELVERHAPTQ
jgi:glycosyltransferase involved in cell wall biosynthesis